ncbi:MAG: DoxX family protein [Bdellovibrionaceae bacterium]|nr:DoxX family protein [Pseudobdellovibrionaceae bacterium]
MKLDLGLLILRVSAGLMMALGHGWGKLTGFSTIVTRFPSLFGLGSKVSLALAVFAEFFCALAVVVGFKTRWAAVPVAITMLVAAVIVHSADPWSKKELALLFAVPFITLFFTDGGRFSVDSFTRAKGRR